MENYFEKLYFFEQKVPKRKKVTASIDVWVEEQYAFCSINFIIPKYIYKKYNYLLPDWEIEPGEFLDFCMYGCDKLNNIYSFDFEWHVCLREGELEESDLHCFLDEEKFYLLVFQALNEAFYQKIFGDMSQDIYDGFKKGLIIFAKWIKENWNTYYKKMNELVEINKRPCKLLGCKKFDNKFGDCINDYRCIRNPEACADDKEDLFATE